MANYQTVFSADDRQLLDSFARQNRELAKVVASMTKVAKESRSAGDEQSRMSRTTRDALKEQQSELSKYIARVRDLRTDLKRNNITQEQYNRLLARQKQLYRESAREGKTSLTSVVMNVGLAAAAYHTLRLAITGTLDENKKLSEGISDTSEKLAEQALKLQIQSGRTPAAVAEKLPQIEQALKLTPTTDLVGGIQLETQLASSGFEKKDIDSGAALQTVLDLKAATNQFGESMGDITESVKSISQFLKAQGVEAPSAAQVRSVGGNLTTLFAGSDIQFPDLSQLAEVAGTLKSAGMTTEQQLAAFSRSRDVLGAAKGATAMRQVVSQMTTFSADEGKVSALEKIGLNPTDLDLVGETFTTALDRLREGIKTLPEEQRAPTLKTLFGQEAGSSAAIMLDPSFTKIVRERETTLGDATLFEKNLNAFQTSRFAARKRLEIEKEGFERRADAGVTFKDIRARADAAAAKEREEQGDGTFEGLKTGVRTYVRNKLIDFSETAGLKPETIIGVEPGGHGAEIIEKDAAAVEALRRDAEARFRFSKPTPARAEGGSPPSALSTPPSGDRVLTPSEAAKFLRVRPLGDNPGEAYRALEARGLSGEEITKYEAAAGAAMRERNDRITADGVITDKEIATETKRTNELLAKMLAAIESRRTEPTTTPAATPVITSTERTTERRTAAVSTR